MGKPRPNYTQLASDLLRGYWLISGSAEFLPAVISFLGRQTVELPELDSAPVYYAEGWAGSGSSQDNARKDKCVAVVPLHGAMTKYDTCVSYGTAYVGQLIRESAEDENVAAVVLDIDSPGGAGNAIAPLVEAIQAVKASGKPVIVHCDVAASAAYWVASQCDAIYMDNSLSEVGSIGALARIVDDRAQDPQTGHIILEVYADESPDKNRAYRDALEGNYAAMKKELSGLVDLFREAVTVSRPGIAADVPGVMTGAVFHVGDAVRYGMADGQKTLSETVEIAFALAET